ncbi:DUF342 domain-containing protein [Clostridium sp. 19966]|uniref:flagellar assembly protein A n=1 Tax=Clostridium sp. 19966 TaxID=2768166 RepID=UPI0028E02198|nr:flagellar assembly protein A [Clostridium sp. 19966]MDT8716686.1 DUF342 domain-containing protein [Clostridium sp. 19966]
MGTQKYKGSTLRQCLKKASEELGISTEDLKYKILEERRTFLKKDITIEVEVPNEEVDNLQIDEESVEEKIIDGTAAVENGRLVVKNPENGGTQPTIIAGVGVFVAVNGEDIHGPTQISEEDTVDVQFADYQAKRYLNIKVSEDDMKAFATIKYEPQIKCNLKDTEANTRIILEFVSCEKIFPDKYTVNEVKEALIKEKIIYGIKNEGIEKCIEASTDEPILVAEGVYAKPSINDTIIYKFDGGNKKNFVDDGSRIDYKNLNIINSVRKGEVLAELITGEDGTNGINIHGRQLKTSQRKILELRAGTGCTVEENKVISSIEGNPCIKNNVICVNEIYEVSGDVDIKSGNINFIGDVKINGNVSEGMNVKSQSSIYVERDVQKAKIVGQGSVIIKGNAISSEIYSGGTDVIVLKRINDMISLKNHMELMKEAINEIKNYGILGKNKSDGEIIKLLIESKFKIISKNCIDIIKDYIYDDNVNNDKLLPLIKTRLIGAAPLSIKKYSELNELLSELEEKIELLKKNLTAEVDTTISYCQECKVSSSGNIYISGKGCYISELTANKSIIFTNDKGILRGGVLSAAEEIRCATVGSNGKVVTKLKVGKHGHIWIDTAFENTTIVVDNREYVIDMPCRQIHAYLDKDNELMVEKLKLI